MPLQNTPPTIRTIGTIRQGLTIPVNEPAQLAFSMASKRYRRIRWDGMVKPRSSHVHLSDATPKSNSKSSPQLKVATDETCRQTLTPAIWCMVDEVV
jgi:hypothetical protein